MAHSRGGVLHLSNSDINVKGSIFTGNAALFQDGGVVDASESKLVFTDCTFSNNSAVVEMVVV